MNLSWYGGTFAMATDDPLWWIAKRYSDLVKVDRSQLGLWTYTWKCLLETTSPSFVALQKELLKHFKAVDGWPDRSYGPFVGDSFSLDKPNITVVFKFQYAKHGLRNFIERKRPEWLALYIGMYGNANLEEARLVSAVKYPDLALTGTRFEMEPETSCCIL